MHEIIANVRSNEELYRNLEVVARYDYRTGNPLLPPSRNFFVSSTQIYRVVLQEGRFFFRFDEDTDLSGNEKKLDGVLEGFDGQHTRIAMKDSICNLHEGRADDQRIYKLLPHTMILRRMPSWVNFPLSHWLSGTKAIQTHPLYRDYKLKMEFVREEQRDGMRTLLLRGTFWQDGWKDPDHFTQHLWLAPDRNYISVRSEWYTWDMGGKPQFIAWVEDLREIGPDVWFPFRYKQEIYDNNWYVKEKKYVLDNHEQLTVEKATLDPHYEDSLFRDIPFPDGSQVYVVKNGKTVRKYIQGGDKFAPPQARGNRPWVVAAIAGLVVVITGVSWLARRCAISRGPTRPLS